MRTRAFSQAARDVLEKKNDNDAEFVAILFRDSNSPDKKEWNDKRDSMLWGFHIAGVEKHGVAAVARPISEAWWLSAIYRREDANKDCKKLESRSYGGGVDHALKIELEEQLGEAPSRTVLNDMVTSRERETDYKLIDSESFLAFRRDFEKAVGLEHLQHTETTP